LSDARRARIEADLPGGRVSTSNVGDAALLPDLLEQTRPGQEVATVTADGPLTPAGARPWLPPGGSH